MEIVGWILAVLGWITVIVCGVWLLVVMWKEHWGWVLGNIVCSIVSLIFVIKFWDESKRPFLGQILGVGLLFLAGMAGGPSAFDRYPNDDDDDIAMIEESLRSEQEESNPPAEAPTTPPVVVPPPIENPRVRPTNQFRPNGQGARTQLVARTAPVRRPTPAPKPIDENEEASKPAAATLPPPKPLPPALILDGFQSPMSVEVLSVGADDGTGLRPLQLRITNQTRKNAKQVRMTLFYLGARKERLKEWSTSLFDPKPPLTSNTTINVTQPAFFMPELTASVAVRVDSIRFDDGTGWP